MAGAQYEDEEDFDKAVWHAAGVHQSVVKLAGVELAGANKNLAETSDMTEDCLRRAPFRWGYQGKFPRF